jgi:hypothetical protein
MGSNDSAKVVLSKQIFDECIERGVVAGCSLMPGAYSAKSWAK